MKRFLFAFIALIAMVSFAIPANAWTTPLMSRTVGKYKVKMQLNINENTNRITGWYYYTSKGPKNKITLSGYGRIERDDYDVCLTESVKGRVTGEFQGDIWISARSIGYSGYWYSPKGTRLYFEVGAM